MAIKFGELREFIQNDADASFWYWFKDGGIDAFSHDLEVDLVPNVDRDTLELEALIQVAGSKFSPRPVGELKEARDFLIRWMNQWPA